MIYAFAKKRLHYLGKFLHLLGWMNEWSMFTRFHERNEQTLIYRRSNEDDDWEEWIVPKWRFPQILINPNSRLTIVLDNCLGKMTKKEQLGNKDLANSWLSIYSRIILDSNQRKAKDYKQVKVLQTRNGITKEYISDFIKIK